VIDVARHAGAHLMVVSPPRRRTPGSPGFYEPPDPLPELDPGEIIRAEPTDAYLVPGVRLRAHAWRVMYRSTGAVGEPTAVTGTVLLPLGRRRVRPLIGFAVGTHGIGDSAAPSRLLPQGHDWEAGLIAMVLARGYAVAVTDYQGLGTPGDHAYMVGRALGPNVLDAMRAARFLDPEMLPEDGPAAIIGYSEGGFAAAWAAQLQPTYAPEIKLAGVAAGAAAADIEVAGPRLSGSFFSFFMAYGGIGYAAAYPELDLDPYLTPQAREGIESLRRSSVLQAALRGPHFMHASELTQPNVLELPDWKARLRENRLGAIAPQTPVAPAPRPPGPDRLLRSESAAAGGLAVAGRRRAALHHARRCRSHQRRRSRNAGRPGVAVSPPGAPLPPRTSRRRRARPRHSRR
jgi:hypothetical protein